MYVNYLKHYCTSKVIRMKQAKSQKEVNEREYQTMACPLQNIPKYT
uniref:Uncharacterized protein n=1 Tax=Anguilla anguilla TaxID=7936 RepID=A0A0E9R2Z5_ANGAN